jgi:hypothetical protein
MGKKRGQEILGRSCAALFRSNVTCSRWSSGYRACFWTQGSPEDGCILKTIKIRLTTFFGGEVKPSARCRKILRYVKNIPGEYDSDASSAEFKDISLLQRNVLVFSASLLGVCCNPRALVDK